MATIFAKFVESAAGVTAAEIKTTANDITDANTIVAVLLNKEDEIVTVDEDGGIA